MIECLAAAANIGKEEEERRKRNSDMKEREGGAEQAGFDLAKVVREP